MKKRFGYSTLLFALAFMFGLAYSAHGQNPFGERTPPISAPRAVTPPATYPAASSNSFFQRIEHSDPRAKPLRQSDQKLAHLKAKLTEALSLKDDKIITDVKEEAKSALNEHFAHDLAVRESELARLTKRADSAESQNKQRRSSRNELIDLQLQSFLLENYTSGIESGVSEARRLFELGRIDEAPKYTAIAGAQHAGPRAAPAVQLPNPLGVDATTRSSISLMNKANKPHDLQKSKAMIEAARKKLAESGSEDERTQATHELKEALGVYFDQDIEERERLLKSVRSDLEKMKQKLEKRASSRDSIVELQFKLFVNEANGLGFFGR